jgi:hypothetical protein
MNSRECRYINDLEIGPANMRDTNESLRKWTELFAKI